MRPDPAAASQDQEARDRHWLRVALDLAQRCPPSATALSVGAVIVGEDGEQLSTGYSRETGPNEHAEEVALSRLNDADPQLSTATLYSSIEPCGERRSRPRPCAELIVAAGLRRVVFASREPPVFVRRPRGAEHLRSAGITVIEIPDLAEASEE